MSIVSPPPALRRARGASRAAAPLCAPLGRFAEAAGDVAEDWVDCRVARRLDERVRA
jgi:hypothetical protein